MTRYELGYSHGYENAYEGHGAYDGEGHAPEHPDDPEYMEGYRNGNFDGSLDS